MSAPKVPLFVVRESHFCQRCPSLRKQIRFRIQFSIGIQVCESWFFISHWTLPHKEYVHDYALHKTKIEFQTRKTRVKYGPVVFHPLEVRGRLSVCLWVEGSRRESKRSSSWRLPPSTTLVALPIYPHIDCFLRLRGPMNQSTINLSLWKGALRDAVKKIGIFLEYFQNLIWNFGGHRFWLWNPTFLAEGPRL